MPSQKREHVLKIRLSDAELKLLDSKAGAATRAAFARSVLFGDGGVKVKTQTVADPALVAGLARIGNNLNQLARAANQSKNLPFLTELHNIKLELQKLLP